MVKRLSAKDIYQTLAHGAHAQETGDVPIYMKLSSRPKIYCDDMLNVFAKVRK